MKVTICHSNGAVTNLESDSICHIEVDGKITWYPEIASEDVEADNSASDNSAMDAIVASDEYAKNNSSVGINARQLAFMAGVEWQQQHQ